MVQCREKPRLGRNDIEMQIDTQAVLLGLRHSLEKWPSSPHLKQALPLTLPTPSPEQNNKQLCNNEPNALVSLSIGSFLVFSQAQVFFQLEFSKQLESAVDDKDS